MQSNNGDQRRMSIDSEYASLVSSNSRALVVCDASAPLQYVGQQDMKHGEHSRHDSESFIMNHSKKLEDDIKQLCQKIKHHEDNIKYLNSLRSDLNTSILDMQVSLGKHHTSSSSRTNEETAEDTVKNILTRYENSAAALLCRTRRNPEAQVPDPFGKDVIGVVATLGTVNDGNLSRLLSKYLGIETMLALVCKTYEGVKALEAYNMDGSVDKNSGLHAFASSVGRPLDDGFLVICLESLRPYTGELLVDDPQQRLDLLKPKALDGETPPGFLGFAVNMISIDPRKLYGVSKTGYGLRETLFYNLFSTLQVYTSRKDMLNALQYITNGAISLDGGLVKSRGVFYSGHEWDVDVKFPCGQKNLNLHQSYYETENRMKETSWKRVQADEDLQTELGLVDRARRQYETKKQEFVAYIAQSSLQMTQAVRVSTPR